MSYDSDRVIEIIKSQEDALGEYFGETVLRIRKEPDPDRREATKIAVDVAKTFMTISLAAFALIGLFARYYLSEGFALNSFKLISLGASAGCALLSMIIGFMAISAVYKAAAGTTKRRVGNEFWGVEQIRGKLNFQAFLGLASIGAFVISVTAWNNPNATETEIEVLSLQLGSSSATTSATFTPPFMISGTASEITITNDRGASFEWQIANGVDAADAEDVDLWTISVSPSE